MKRTARHLAAACAGALLAVAAFHPASALVVDSANQERTRSAPVDDPGWAHVGQRAGTSAIYVGNGWVLTAGHSGLGSVIFEHVPYEPVPDSGVELEDPEGTSMRPDLLLFRIEPEPPLPTLRLRRAPPRPGALAILVGLGRGRGTAVAWRGTGGFRWDGARQKTWGTNHVEEIGLDVGRKKMNTRCFRTTFDETGTPHEAQATLGDSGGAAFLRGSEGWELAGVLFSIGAFPEQEPKVALYGNVTNMADISHYRDQILRIIESDLPTPPEPPTP